MFSSGITDGNIKIGGQAGGGLMVMVESPQQEQFFKMMSYLERGRMEEQRCALSTGPQVLNGLVHFFNLLANSQGQRLDDQQVSLPSLPGIQKLVKNQTSPKHFPNLLHSPLGQNIKGI
uniref:Uncharacterized protein n=1 Tax=Mola mola TaxID=94237 RepID=A0A3Q4BA28_MOLML